MNNGFFSLLGVFVIKKAGKIDPKALESDFSQAFQIYNTATLLYMVHKLPALREIAHETEIPPVPFGPQWTAEKVFEELKLKGFEEEYPLSNYGYNTLAVHNKKCGEN